MISEHFSSLQGIEIYPIVSMMICLLVFAFAIIWTARLDKKYVQHMEGLPLENENNNNSEIKNEVN